MGTSEMGRFESARYGAKFDVSDLLARPSDGLFFCHRGAQSFRVRQDVPGCSIRRWRFVRPFARGGGRPLHLRCRCAPMATSTLFDVASLTKVTATTTAAMLLYQWGEFDLDARLTNFYGDGFAATDPEGRNHRPNLLLHDAGWPPDPTPSYCTPSFACPETTSTPLTKRHTTFSCQHKIFASISTQKLARPPGAKYVYSDISMISHVCGWEACEAACEGVRFTARLRRRDG